MPVVAFSSVSLVDELLYQHSRSAELIFRFRMSIHRTLQCRCSS